MSLTNLRRFVENSMQKNLFNPDRAVSLYEMMPIDPTKEHSAPRWGISARFYRRSNHHAQLNWKKRADFGSCQ